MMNLKNDWCVTGFGVLALLSAGCGDDVNSNVSASASEASSAATEDPTTMTTQGSNSMSETTPTTSTTAGSDSEGETTTSTTGPDVTTTEGETWASSTSTTSTTTTTDPGTTTEESTSTTEGVDTDTGTSSSTTNDTGNDTEGSDCALAQMHKPCDADSDDALHALGINCTSLGGDWQDNVNAVSVANLSFQAPPPIGGRRTWQVAESYGTFIDPNTNAPFWGPREGEKVLLISSGLLPAPNGNGQVIVQDGDVYNDSFVSFLDTPPWDDNVMPPPMSAQNGSPDPLGFTNCDGTNDCSNTLLSQWNLGFGDAEDKMWFGFELTAPAIANGHIADANGYTFDFAYFSAEFPEYVDSQFNDIFVVWQSSENYTGNVTFINGQPMTVTALWPIDYPSFDQHLQGTGHIADGGATGWYKATGGVNPGETFSLAFAIFDMGDSSFDTTAILDNWKWDCEGCVPNEVDDCEIAPQ